MVPSLQADKVLQRYWVTLLWGEATQLNFLNVFFSLVRGPKLNLIRCLLPAVVTDTRQKKGQNIVVILEYEKKPQRCSASERLFFSVIVFL